MARQLLKGVLMEEENKPLSRALAILREVTHELTKGVNKTEFERHFRRKFVSPGISVQRHVDELRISGSLDETNTSMRLKPKPVPAD